MEPTLSHLIPSKNQTNEEIIVELESDQLQSLQLGKRSLVGKVCSSKILNKGVVKSIILLKAWRSPNEVKVTNMGINKFLFTFLTKDEAKDVIDKGPWYVMGIIINLQYWVPQISAHEDRVPFWVQLHGLPLEMMSTTNAAKIVGKVEVQEVENPFVGNRLIRIFIRVKTLIDINKPLITWCWVPRKGMPRIWIPLRYERLQGLCYKCGIIGHEQKDCKQEKIMETSNPSVPKSKASGKKIPQSGMEARNNRGEPGKEEAKSLERKEEDDSTDKDPALSHVSEGTKKQLEEEVRAHTEKPDLKQGKPRAGLGPRNLSQLHIEKEFIGIKDPVVILDYPSPTQETKVGALLSKENITKCKMACRVREKDLGYYVEFPKEDSDNDKEQQTTRDNLASLPNNEEKQLILGWNQALSLKRKQTQEFLTEGDVEEGGKTKQTKFTSSKN
ncbi:Zinc finger, CCHC-type [Sesbania bispinosa]|nr:Zinc finger, CCHC-type [Sesbania bispinosa]